MGDDIYVRDPQHDRLGEFTRELRQLRQMSSRGEGRLDDLEKALQPMRAAASGQQNEVEARLRNVEHISAECQTALRGVREIGDYAGEVQQLQAELTDTSGAVEQMMDLLEKTLTTKDADALLNEQETHFNDKLHQAQVRVQSVDEDLGALHGKVETVAADLMNVANEVRRHGEADGLRLTDKINDVDEQLTRGMQSSAARLDELQKLCERRERDWTAAFDAVQRNFEERLAQQADVHQAQIEKLRETVDSNQARQADAARRVSDEHTRALVAAKESAETQIAQLGHSLQGLATKTAQETGSLGEKMDAKLATTEQAVALLAAKLDSTNEAVLDVAARTQANASSLSDAEARLNTLVQSETTRLGGELHKAVGNAASEAAEQLRGFKESVAQHELQVEQKLSSVEVTLTGLLEQQSAQTAQLKRSVEDTTTDLQSRVFAAQQRADQVAAEARSLSADVDARIGSIADSTSQTVQGTEQTARDMCAKVEASITARIETQAKAMQQQHTAELDKIEEVSKLMHDHQVQVTNALGSMESKHAKFSAESRNKVDNEAKRLQDSVKRLGEQATKSNADHDRRAEAHARSLADLATRTQSTLDGKAGELLAKIAAVDKKAEEVGLAAQRSVTDAASTMESRLKQQATESAGQRERISAEVQQARATADAVNEALAVLGQDSTRSIADLRAMGDNLTREIAKEASSTAARFHTVQANHSAMQQSLQKVAQDAQAKLSEEIHAIHGITDDISAQLTQAGTEIGAQRDALERIVREQPECITKACDTVRKDVSRRFAEEDAKSESQRQAFQQSLDNLQQTLVESRADADAKLVRQRTELDQLAVTTTSKTDSAFASVNKRIAELDTTVRDTKKLFTDELSKANSARQQIEGRLVTVDSKLAGSIKTNHKQLSDLIARADTKLVSEIASVTDQLRKAREGADAATASLDKQLAAVSTDHKRRLDELASELKSAQQTASAQSQAVDAKCVALTTELGKRIDELTSVADLNLATALGATSDLATVVAENKTQQAVSLRDLEDVVQLNQAEGAAADKKIADAAAHSLADVLAKLNRQKEYTAKTCDQLDAKFFESIDRQSKHIEAEKVHFAELVDTVTAKFETRSDSLERRIEQLATATTSNDEAFKEACNRLDRRCTEINQAQTTRVEKMQRDMEDDHVKLETKLHVDIEAKQTVCENRIDALQQVFGERCRELESTLTHKTQTHDTRFDGVDKVTAEIQQQLQTSCATLDDKTTSLGATLSDRIASNMQQLGEDLKAMQSAGAVKDAEVAAQLDAHAISLADTRSQFTELMTSTKKVQADQDIAQDKRMDQLQHKFGELMAAMETEMRKKNDMQDAELEQLTKTAIKHHDDFSELMAEMDKKISDNATQWQQDAKHFGSLCAGLQGQFTDEQKSVAARINDVRDRMLQIDHDWAEASSQLDRKFAEQTETLNHQFVQEAQRQEDRLNTIDHGFDQKIKVEHELFLSKCHLLEKETSDLKTALEQAKEHMHNTIEAERSHVRTSLGEISHRLETQHEHLMETDRALDEKVNLKCHELDTRATGIQQHFDEICLNLEFRLTEKIMEQDKRVGDIAETQAQHFAQLSGSCADLNSRLESECSAQNARIADHHAHFTRVTSEVENVLTDRIEALQEHVFNVCEGLSTTLKTQNDTLERNLSGKFAGLEEACKQQFEHLNTTAASLEKKMDDDLAEMRQTVTSNVEHITSSSQALEQQLSDQQAALGAKLAQKNEEQDTRLHQAEVSVVDCHNEVRLLNEVTDKLNGRIDQNYSHFSTGIAQMDAKFVQETQQAKERLDQAERALVDNNRDVLAVCEEIKTTLSDRLDSLDEHRLDIDRQVEDNFKQTSDFCTQLDKTAQEQHTLFTKLHADLDNKLSAQSFAVKQDIESEHDHFTNICASLDEKFSVVSDACTGRISQLADEVTANHDQVTQMYTNMDKAASEHMQKHSEAIAALQTGLSAAQSSLRGQLGKLEGDLKKESQARIEKSAQHYEHFTATSTKLDTHFSEKMQVLSNRIDEVGTLSLQKIQTLNNSNSKLEQHLDTNIQRIDSSLKEQQGIAERNRRQLAQQYEQIDARASDIETKSLETAEANRVHFAERCDAIDTSLLQRTNDLASQLKEFQVQSTARTTALSNDMDNKHAEHGGRLATLDETVNANGEKFGRMNAELQDKTAQELNAQAERIQDHSKHFAAAVAIERQTYTEELNKVLARVTTIQNDLGEAIRLNDSRVTQQGGKLQENHDSLILRVNESATVFKAMNEALAQKTQEQLHQLLATQTDHHAEHRAACDKLSDTCAQLNQAAVEQAQQSAAKRDALRSELMAMQSDLDMRCTNGLRQDKERLDKLSDHVDGNIQRLLTAFDNLQNQFVEERAAQAGRVETTQQYFNELCTNIEQRMDDKLRTHAQESNDAIGKERDRVATALESLVRKTENEHMESMSRIDELNGCVGTSQAQFRAQCAEMDERFSSSLAAQNAQLNDNFLEATEAVATLDEKYQTQGELRDSQIFEIKDAMSEVQNTQSGALREVERIKTRVAAQEDSLNGLSTALTEQHQHFSDVCAMLDTKTRDVSNVAAVELERVHGELVKTCDSVGHKNIEAVNELKERVEHHRGHFSTVCNDLSSSMENRGQATDKRMSDLNAAVDIKTAQLSNELEVLDKKLMDKIGVQNSRMREQNAHFGEMCAAIDGKTEETLKRQQQQFADTCASLDRKLVEWTRDADVRIDDTTKVLSEHHRHFTAVCTELDTQVARESDALRDQLAKAQEQANTNIAAVENRLAEMAAGLSKRCDDLNTAVATQESTFADACGQLKSEQAEQFEKISDRLDQEQQHRSDLNSALDNKFTNRCDAHEGRLDEQATTVHEHHRYFTSICEQLDQKYSDAALAQKQQQAEQAAENDKALRKMSDTVSKQIVEQGKALDRRLETSHQQFSQVLLEQDTKFTDACVALDKKLVDQNRQTAARAESDNKAIRQLVKEASQTMADEVKRTNTKFTDVCIGLDKKTAQDLSELKKGLAGDADQLQQTLSQAREAFEAKITSEMDALDEKLTDSVIGLDQKATTFHEDSCNNLSKQHKHFTGESQQLAAAVKAQVAELEKVLKQSIKTVDDAHSRRDGELENNLSATRDEVMAMCVQVQQQQTDGVRTLDAAVSAASKQAAKDLTREVGALAERTEQRVDMLDKRLTESKESTRQELSRLGDSVARQPSLLSSTCDPLNMAITTLGQEVGRSNKAHAKRLEAVAAELQNKTTVLDARVTAVTEDLSRGTKKLRADAEDQTRIVNSRFDKFTTDTKVNLASKVQDALDRLGPVEAAANEARQTAVALTLLKMEVDELKQIPKELQRIEDKIEDTADERDARVSEIEVDMAVLQATSQAV